MLRRSVGDGLAEVAIVDEFIIRLALSVAFMMKSLFFNFDVVYLTLKTTRPMSICRVAGVYSSSLKHP